MIEIVEVCPSLKRHSVLCKTPIGKDPCSLCDYRNSPECNDIICEDFLREDGNMCYCKVAPELEVGEDFSFKGRIATCVRAHDCVNCIGKFYPVCTFLTCSGEVRKDGTDVKFV